MRLLLDTHILIWIAGFPERLSRAAADLLEAEESLLHYSPVSIWEIVIKNQPSRKDFEIDVHVLRRELEDRGYEELPVTTVHALAVGALPAVHKDPFDRLLIAQATAEGITLLTADKVMARYPGPIRLV